MKKTLSLFLVLTMLVITGLASSETLEIRVGKPSSCSLETFMYNFNAMQNETGYTFSWNENIGEYNNFQVYTGMSEDEMTAVMIYTMNDGIALATILGRIQLDYNDQTSAVKLSTWLNTAISSMTFGLYIGDNGAESVDINVLSDRFANDLLPLVSDMTACMNDEEKLTEGFACCSSVLGFPTGIKVLGTRSSTSITLEITISVTSSDGQIIIS